jgi:hypothetical protein
MRGVVGFVLGTAAKYLRGVAGIGLGTTIMYLRRSTSGAAGNGLCTTIKYLRGAADIGLGTTIKYLRHTTSAAAGNGLGTTIKYLVNRNSGAVNNWANAHYSKAGHEFCLISLLCSGFLVTLEPRIGACPSVRVCVGPGLARCVH